MTSEDITLTYFDFLEPYSNLNLNLTLKLNDFMLLKMWLCKLIKHTHTQTHTYTLVISTLLHVNLQDEPLQWDCVNRFTVTHTPTYTHTHTHTHLHTAPPLFVLSTVFLTIRCAVQGVLHTVAGYLLYTSLTFKYVFDHHHDDVYWCTADIGWITGHSYIAYGPLANAATGVLVSQKHTVWFLVEKEVEERSRSIS